MTLFGIHDRTGPNLESDDLTRMAACNPSDLVVLHPRRDRWAALHKAMPSARIHARIDFRGPLDNPIGDAQETARLAKEYPYVYSWRARNEPQIETPSATADSWRRYLIDYFNEARRLCPENTLLAIPAIAPGIYGAEWLRASIAAGANGRAHFLDLHAYGTPEQIEAWVRFARSLWTGPIVITECNPGPGVGRRADIERWPHDLADILGRLAKYRLLGIVLFGWVWDNPDVPMDLPPNIKGTAVEAEIKRLNHTEAPTMTFIDQAELDFLHKWQNERNANNEDPSSLPDYQTFLRGVGKDPSNPRHYGAMVADASPPAYTPKVEDYRAPTVSIQGRFATTPKGVILHGSRSGQPMTEAQEALSTARYCQGGTGGNDLAWTATIGPDVVYLHTTASEWGWNAGASSKEYLAVEFAQPHVTDQISDAQIRTFCYVFQWMRRWQPGIPAVFPMHSELPQGIQAGKTDVFPKGSTQGEELRARIAARLKTLGVT